MNAIGGYKIKNGGIVTLFGVGMEYRDYDIVKHEDSKANTESHEASFSPMLELKMGIEI